MLTLTWPSRAGIQLPGHRCCPGCAGPIATNLILKVVGKNVIFFGTGGCGFWTVKTVPCFTLHFSGVGSGATGIVSALEVKGKTDIKVLSFAGDGGTSDIGFGKLSACAARGDNFTHFCYDNEGYMNTGIQKTQLTPYAAWTTTTPQGKRTPKKDMPRIMAYHRIPYVATATIAYNSDFIKKIRKAYEMKGFKYIHLLQPCPTGWRYPPEKTVEISRLSVQTRIFNLYEIENGNLRITQKTKSKPVEEYLMPQGRFRYLSESDIQKIQIDVDKRWERLEKLNGTNIWD